MNANLRKHSWFCETNPLNHTNKVKKILVQFYHLGIVAFPSFLVLVWIFVGIS